MKIALALEGMERYPVDDQVVEGEGPEELVLAHFLTDGTCTEPPHPCSSNDAARISRPERREDRMSLVMNIVRRHSISHAFHDWSIIKHL